MSRSTFVILDPALANHWRRRSGGHHVRCKLSNNGIASELSDQHASTQLPAVMVSRAGAADEVIRAGPLEGVTDLLDVCNCCTLSAVVRHLSAFLAPSNRNSLGGQEAGSSIHNRQVQHFTRSICCALVPFPYPQASTQRYIRLCNRSDNATPPHSNIRRKRSTSE